MDFFFLESTACLPDNEFAGSSRLRLWWILGPGSSLARWPGLSTSGNNRNSTSWQGQDKNDT